MAKDLFLRTCSVDLKSRYSAEEAIQHPYITGIKDAKIPLTLSEELLKYEITELCEPVFNIMLFISFTIKGEKNKFRITKKKKNLQIIIHEKIPLEHNSEFNSYKISPTDTIENSNTVQVLNSANLKRRFLAEKYQRCNTLKENPINMLPATKFNTPSSQKTGTFFGNRFLKNNKDKNIYFNNTSLHSKIQVS